MIGRYEQFSSAIAAIYKVIQKIERDEASKFGLKGPHVQCLVTMSSCPKGLTAAELCEICEKDKAAISRAVTQLEKKELLYRSGNGDNNYRAALLLTPKGAEIANDLRQTVLRAVEAGGKGISDQDRAALYDSLARIAENLQEISASGLEK